LLTTRIMRTKESHLSSAPDLHRQDNQSLYALDERNKIQEKINFIRADAETSARMRIFPWRFSLGNEQILIIDDESGCAK